MIFSIPERNSEFSRRPPERSPAPFTFLCRIFLFFKDFTNIHRGLAAPGEINRTNHLHYGASGLSLGVLPKRQLRFIYTNDSGPRMKSILNSEKA